MQLIMVVVGQASVYRSALHAVRLGLAVALGVGLQGGIAFVFGASIWTFAVVATIALALSRWRRIGPQGLQVAVSAFFAYSVWVNTHPAASRPQETFSLILLVIVGSAIGLLVNIVIVPPIRYRSVEYGIGRLAASTGSLIDDIAEVLRSRAPAPADANAWWHRARRLEDFSRQVRQSIHAARETARWNPARPLRRRPPPYTGYQVTVDLLSGVETMLRSIADVLHDTSHDPSTPHVDFLRHYAEFLTTVSETMDTLERPPTGDTTSRADELGHHIDRAYHLQRRTAHSTAANRLNLSTDSHVYGTLLLDAERLITELTAGRERLRRMTVRSRVPVSSRA